MYTILCQHYTILYCSVLNYTIQFDVLYYAKLCHTIQNDLNKSSLNSCSTKLLNTGLDQAARQKYEYWPHLEYFCRAAFQWTLVQSIWLLFTIQIDVLYYTKLCRTIQNDLNKNSLNSCSTKLFKMGSYKTSQQKYKYWAHLEYFCRAAFKWTLVQSILLLTTAFCYFSLATLHYTMLYYNILYHNVLCFTIPCYTTPYYTTI